MKAPFEWLQSLVEINSSPQELAKKLSLISIGVDKVNYFDNQPVLDIDVTYNRGDLLSMVGLAYEIAFIEKSQLKLPELKTDISHLPILNDWQIKRDNKSCSLYIAVLLKVKQAKSPDWLEKRLKLVGNQSRGNIVDIANYVMWEYGQPFHTFDAKKLSSKVIRIQPAGERVEFTTLDGKRRSLNPDDILILADQKPVALAGIMGGLESEIDSQTNEVLLEVALFNPFQIRKTAMSQGLFSDAANHFIHKPSPNISVLALRRILDLYQKYAQAEVIGIKIDGQVKVENPLIKFKAEDVERLIGLSIESKEIERILERLYFKVQKQDNTFLVQAPHWRSDIRIKEDVIEEVVRGFGYWRLQPQPLPLTFTGHKEGTFYYKDGQFKNFLTGQGLYQLNSFGFFSQKEIKKFAIQTKELIKVSNPISAEAEFLKTTLLPGLAIYLQKNKRKPLPLVKPKGVFEINSVYLPNKTVQEKTNLGIGLYQKIEFYRLLSNLLAYWRLDYSQLKLSLQLGSNYKIQRGVDRGYRLDYQGKFLAWLVKVTDLWLIEFDYQRILSEIKLQPQLNTQSKFSPLVEELTFTLEEEIKSIEFLFHLASFSKKIKDIVVVDTYKDRISLRLAYLDETKQITSKEVADLRLKIVELANSHGLKLVGKI